MAKTLIRQRTTLTFHLLYSHICAEKGLQLTKQLNRQLFTWHLPLCSKSWLYH